MKLQFNGALIDIFETSSRETVTVREFMMALQLDGKLGALAINKNFIPRSHYETQLIHNGDHIEFLTPMAGG